MNDRDLFFFVLQYRLLSVDVVLWVSLGLFSLEIGLREQYYTGKDANTLRFMGSVAGQQD